MSTDRTAGGILALLGMAVAAEASTFNVAFLVDPVGPKALPYLAAAVLVLSGVGLLVRPGEEPAWPARRDRLRLAAAVATLVAYALVLSPLGFVVATVMVMTALSLLFGGTLLKSALAATGLAAVLWYMFVWLLRLPLPLGSLWEGLLAGIGVAG